MTSEILTVPHNVEAEQSVIGGLLLDDDNSERVQKVLAMLKPESFYIRVHQIVFAELRDMFRANKPVDGLTLFDALESKGLTEQIGGFAYIAQIAKNNTERCKHRGIRCISPGSCNGALRYQPPDRSY